MGKTSIEWCTDTWQVTAGCVRISKGCENCYAEVMSGRLAAMAQTDLNAGRDPGKKRVYLEVVNQKDGRGVNGYGPKSGWSRRVVTLPDRLEEPLHWKKPRRVFVNSMSDLFHRDVPFEFIDLVFAAMALCPQHTFQVLTKRPERMAEYFAVSGPEASNVSLAMDRLLQEGVQVPAATLSQLGATWFEGERDYSDSMHRYAVPPGYEFNNFIWPLPNVWLGTSVEDQPNADKRIPFLLEIPASVRFLSMEPLLGPVDLRKWLSCYYWAHEDGRELYPLIDGTEGPAGNGWWIKTRPRVNWVIAGGESGPGARPSHPDWFRSLRDQCAAAGVPFFFKQWGSWVDPSEFDASGYDHVVMDENGITVWPDGSFSRLDGNARDGSVRMWGVGKKAAGRLLDGVQHDGMPGGAR